jgi:membrane protein
MIFLTRYCKSLYLAIYDAIDHDGIEQAGYLAFLLMLSIFPFILIFISFIGFFGDHDTGEFMINVILESKWANFIDALKPRIMEITTSPPNGFFTFALISATWTASSIFEGLRTVLNRAYRVTKTPPYLFRRLVSIIEFFAALGVSLALASIFIISPVISQYLTNISFLKESIFLQVFAPQTKEFRYALLICLAFLATSYLYYTLPNRTHKVFVRTFPGASFSLVAWSLFVYLFGLYINNFHQVNFIYGGIAGIIIALLFFYFMAIIFIIGAELNYHLEAKNE